MKVKLAIFGILVVAFAVTAGYRDGNVYYPDVYYGGINGTATGGDTLRFGFVDGSSYYEVYAAPSVNAGSDTCGATLFLSNGKKRHIEFYTQGGGQRMSQDRVVRFFGPRVDSIAVYATSQNRVSVVAWGR